METLSCLRSQVAHNLELAVALLVVVPGVEDLLTETEALVRGRIEPVHPPRHLRRVRVVPVRRAHLQCAELLSAVVADEVLAPRRLARVALDHALAVGNATARQ